jgi:hypothetical protein
MNEANIIKAPAGGMVSKVNDAFYKGGQFMPETGLFCGAIKKAKKHAKTPGNWAEVLVASGYKGFWVSRKLAGESRHQYLENKPFETQDEAVAYAKAAIESRAENNRSRKLIPHPTLLTVKD